jgi:hypothetical protein
MPIVKDVAKQLARMQSGECRWVLRDDVHVYCHAPRGHEPTYCVVCPTAGLAYGNWASAMDAAAAVVGCLN